MSNNSSPADNQQVSKKINDDYFSGFVDGEGCFYVGFSKRDDLPFKWQIITEFHVSQNLGSKNVLEALKNRLGCGYLKPNHAKSLKDKTWILTQTFYGTRFCSAIWKKNIFATQFHPEKSQTAGLRIIRNFIEYPSSR